jgi:hypothetical protein
MVRCFLETTHVRPLEDALALPSYTRTIEEKPLKGRDIKGIPDGGHEGFKVILHEKRKMEG